MLAFPLAAQAIPSWVTEAQAERQSTMRELDAQMQAALDSLRELGVDIELTPPEGADDSMPRTEGTKTVATADGGLFFDTKNSRLAYLSNVRIKDQHAHLRCREALFLSLPPELTSRGKDRASSTLSSKNATVPAPAATPKKKKKAATAPDLPASIRADKALVDAGTGQVYLTAKEGITVTQGENEVSVTPADGLPSVALLTDGTGDILITKGSVKVDWTDSDGSKFTVQTEDCDIFFQRSTHRVAICGKCSMTSPQGSISCQDYLVIKLDATEEPQKDEGAISLLTQFSGMKVNGLAAVSAKGQVLFSTPATETRPAAMLAGDELEYDAEVGSCSLSGEECRITYGKQSLYTKGSLVCAPNGDITLSGDEIRGTYERPAGSPEEAPLPGEFSTKGKLTFTAATGVIHAPAGITTKDPLTSVNCTGPVEVALRKSGKKTAADSSKTGGLNLALMEYDEPATLRASGGVHISHCDGKDAQPMELTCEDLAIDIPGSTLRLSSPAGARTHLKFGTAEVTAEGEQTASELNIAENGDISLTGDKLLCSMPSDKGDTRINCGGYLRLEKASGTVTVGPGSELTSPSAVITANEELKLVLSPGEEKPGRKDKQFAQFDYNFDGLLSAHTAAGGSVRTEQGSMQCTGEIAVEMAPEGAPKGQDALAGVKSAVARGNVRIAGKDKSGKMLRASGSTLSLLPNGSIRLSGSSVTLSDSINTHTASGGNAAVTVDKYRNVHITGEKHTTTATRIHDQIRNTKTN